MRVFLLFLAVAAAALVLAWRLGARWPDRYDPWARPDLREPPGPFVRYQLGRLGGDPAACRAALAQAGARFEALPDSEGGNGCGWTGAVRLRTTGAAQLAHPVIVACPLAATLVLIDRQVLQPAARDIYSRPLLRIEHVGSYACRNVYHREEGALSAHARAEAIDLTGFDLAGGRSVTVARGWSTPGADGLFLHRVHDQGCRFAGMLLGPDYNAAHRSHFHVQQGGWGYCR